VTDSRASSRQSYQRTPLQGEIRVPGDKSISHRALLFGALGAGTSRISGLLRSGDCQATWGCLQALGVQMDEEGDDVLIHGNGLRGLRAPDSPLDCVRSGTTMRLLAGILSGQPFGSSLTGHPQLLARPMGRIIDPLSRMGAIISGEEGRAPLQILPAQLTGVPHRLAVASAQIKSALIFAGLWAEGETTVIQPGPARDHTERMLSAMGADLRVDGLEVRVRPASRLEPLTLRVPGDISSAAFPLVAALLVPGSRIVLRDVGLNPTRTGLLDVLRAMGADVSIERERIEGGEPVGDLVVSSSSLRSTTIEGESVVRMIDEFPILAVAATQAEGETVVRDAEELRVKETDRIGAIVRELRALGAQIDERPDGFVVRGPTSLRGESVEGHADHRIVMALTVAGLISSEPISIQGAAFAGDSYPGFLDQLRRLGGKP